MSVKVVASNGDKVFVADYTSYNVSCDECGESALVEDVFNALWAADAAVDAGFKMSDRGMMCPECFANQEGGDESTQETLTEALVGF